MKRVKVAFKSEFKIIAGNKRSQAAVMVLPPEESEGGHWNKHKGSDQWLYVSAGTGVARINGRNHPLNSGTLLLIEHGETHEIHNNSEEPLETLNFYVPPGFRTDEKRLPAGKSKGPATAPRGARAGKRSAKR